MFFKVLSRFKDNRTKLIIILIIIALIILFIKAVNKYTFKIRGESSSSNYTTAFQKDENNKLEYEVINNGDSNSSIKIKENTINNSENAIKAFIYYCNNKQVKYAYNMLTDECKEALYPTQELFDKNYCQKNFDTVKQCNYTNYLDINNIYRLVIKTDSLVTGSVNSENDVIEYITVVKNNGEFKLNISGFVKKENLNKQSKNEYLEAEVLEKITYIDSELYTVKINNTTLVDMILSDMTNKYDIYIADANENKSYIISNEYTQDDVTIKYKSDSIVKLKFNRKYTSENKKIKKIVFNNVLLINRQHYDNTSTQQTDGYNTTYEYKYTTYPQNISFEINV